MLDDEITRAQERLALTLDRARASEDRELAGRVRDEGFQLVQQLNGLLRMAHLHSLDNKAFDQPIVDVGRSLQRLSELLGTLNLAVVEDQLYLNEIRIRADERGGGRELGGELARHGVGGLRVHQPPTEADLRRFVACFAQKPAEQAPRAALRAALLHAGVLGLELLGSYRVRVAGTDAAADQRASAGQALARASDAVLEAFDNLGRGRLFNPLPARRAVAELLKAGQSAGSEPPGLEPHLSHALRVCRLAVGLGRELGLAEGLLQDLGVAALLHDVGYADCDAQGQPRPPSFAQHPSTGARLLLRQRGFHISKIRRVRAVLGHHAPAQSHGRKPSLLARILRIAEDYDSLVQRAALQPQDALGRMAAAAGSHYDPDLMQAFVNLQLGAPAARPSAPAVAEPLELSLVEPAAAAPRAATAATRPAAPARAPHPSPASASGQGQITQGIPVRLMHDLLLAQHTGRLSCQAAAESRELHFVKGTVVAVESSRREHGLPSLLLRAGLVELEGLEWAMEEQARGGHTLGQVLVGGGLLESEQLEQALLQRARNVVADLAEWEEGRYRIVSTPGPPSDVDLSERLSTDELIVGAVRQLRDPDVVRFALGNLDRVPGRHMQRLRPAVLALLRPDESALLGRVDGKSSARQLLTASGLGAEDGPHALLTLLALGLVEYHA